MGAVHAGHVSLVTRAARDCDDVAVSIFVNPTQFGPQEDFARYPRTLAADTAQLAPHGVRWIYAPEVSAVYPPGDATRIVVGGPAVRFEGERRPGHFDGVASAHPMSKAVAVTAVIADVTVVQRALAWVTIGSAALHSRRTNRFCCWSSFTYAWRQERES